MPTATSSLTVRKLLPCPPAQAFEAWTNPKQFEKWFEPESGMRVKAKIDLRVGGKYRLGFMPPDGSRTKYVGGEYLVVEPPHHLEYTWSMEKGFEREIREHTVVKIEFKAVGKNRTELVLRHERFKVPAVRDGHREGWTNILACMAEAMTARNVPSEKRTGKKPALRLRRKMTAK